MKKWISLLSNSYAILLTAFAIISATALAQEEKVPEVEEPVSLEAAGLDLFVSSTETAEPEESMPQTEIVGDVKYDVDEMVVLSEGQLYELKTSKDVKKVATNHGLIDCIISSKRKLNVSAIGFGTTNLHIHFEDGSSVTYNFRIKANSHNFESLIDQLFPNHKLEVVPIRDSAVFLRGTVTTTAEVEQIEAIAGEFWPNVHNHVKAAENQSTTQQLSSEGSSVKIPRGMRVITVPLLEWQRNPNGPNFNKVVSLYATRKISKEGETPEQFSSDETLIAHNLEVFSHSPDPEKGVRHLALIVHPTQINGIHLATQKDLKFIAVSQNVTIDTPYQLPGVNSGVRPLPQDSQYPAATLPMPAEPQQAPVFQDIAPKAPVGLPSYPPGPGVAEPSDDIGEFPPTENRSQYLTPVPQKNQPSPPIGLPGPPQIPLGNPAGQKAQPRTHVDPNNIQPKRYHSLVPDQSVSELKSDIRALRSDVQRLIELLESRENKKKEKVEESQTTIIPKEGKVVLYFHADWCQVCKKMNSIVSDLRTEGHRIVSINIDNEKELASQCYIKAVPSLVLLDNGGLIPGETQVGAFTRESLKRYLNLNDFDNARLKVSQSPRILEVSNSVQVAVNNSEANDSEFQKQSSPVLGSGVIVRLSPVKKHILTTAHLIRNANDPGQITVKFFSNESDEIEPVILQGKLVSIDEEADLALIEIRSEDDSIRLRPETNILLAKDLLEVEEAVTISGFTQKDDQRSEVQMKRMKGHVISIGKFLGPANFQIANALVLPGMSGSAVLNKSDELCGIVTAADQGSEETICIGQEVIKEFLHKVQFEILTKYSR